LTPSPDQFVEPKISAGFIPLSLFLFFSLLRTFCSVDGVAYWRLTRLPWRTLLYFFSRTRHLFSQVSHQTVTPLFPFSDFSRASGLRVFATFSVLWSTISCASGTTQQPLSSFSIIVRPASAAYCESRQVVWVSCLLLYPAPRVRLVFPFILFFSLDLPFQTRRGF